MQAGFCFVYLAHFFMFVACIYIALRIGLLGASYSNHHCSMANSDWKIIPWLLLLPLVITVIVAMCYKSYINGIGGGILLYVFECMVTYVVTFATMGTKLFWQWLRNARN